MEGNRLNMKKRSKIKRISYIGFFIALFFLLVFFIRAAFSGETFHLGWRRQASDYENFSIEEDILGILLAAEII